MNELYHYGVKGMKWGVRREKRKQANTKRVNELYKNNERISRDFRNSKGKSNSSEKTITYLANKSAQLSVRYYICYWKSYIRYECCKFSYWIKFDWNSWN